MANAVQLGAAIIDLLINEGLIDAQLLDVKAKAGAGGKAAGKQFIGGFTEAWSAIQIAQAFLAPIVHEAIQQSREAALVQSDLNVVAAESVDLVNAYADAQLRRLGVDDEVVAGGAAKIAKLTKLQGDELIRATNAALNWSALSGKAYEAAFQDVTKYISNGTVVGFQRYGLALEDTGNQLGNLRNLAKATAAGQDILNARATEGATALGAFNERISNQMQLLGDAILNNQAFDDLLNDIAGIVEEMVASGMLQRWIDSFIKGADAIAQVVLWLTQLGNWAQEHGIHLGTPGQEITNSMESANKAIADTIFGAQKLDSNLQKIPPTLSEIEDGTAAAAGNLEKAAASAEDWLKHSTEQAERNSKIMSEEDRKKKIREEENKRIREEQKQADLDTLHTYEGMSEELRRMAFDLFPVIGHLQERYGATTKTIAEQLAEWAKSTQEKLDLDVRGIDATRQIWLLAQAGNEEAERWIREHPEKLAALDAEQQKLWALLTPEERQLKILEYQKTAADAITESVAQQLEEWTGIEFKAGRTLQHLTGMQAFSAGIGDARVDDLLKALSPFANTKPGDLTSPQAAFKYFGSGIQGRTRDQLSLLDELGRKTGEDTSGFRFGSLGAIEQAIRDLSRKWDEMQKALRLAPNQYSTGRQPTGGAGDPLHIVYDSQTSQASQDAALGLR